MGDPLFLANFEVQCGHMSKFGIASRSMTELPLFSCDHVVSQNGSEHKRKQNDTHAQ